MKNLKILFIILLLPMFLMTGCDKTLAYSSVERDNYNTGGNLTFSYDEITHTITFGGEGETVQFYEEDVAKGWSEEGCRVGVKIFVPNKAKDLKSGTATMNGTKLSSEDYLYGDEGAQYAIFQPIVSQENRIIELKITWQEGFEEQTYTIVVLDDTMFMEKQN